MTEPVPAADILGLQNRMRALARDIEAGRPADLGEIETRLKDLTASLLNSSPAPTAEVRGALLALLDELEATAASLARAHAHVGEDIKLLTQRRRAASAYGTRERGPTGR